MPSQIFPGIFDSLPHIASFVLAIAQDGGFQGFDLYQIETGVDEACSNIIEHAYCEECSGLIEIDCEVVEDRLIIVIKDHGLPFDPKKIQKPKITAKLKDRSGHGLGIYMMQQWMDEVEYTFLPGTNILRLVKVKTAGN